jgi:Cation efflux family
VVKLGWLELTGFLGWLFWSLVHIYFLIEARDRFIVAFTWLWDYVTLFILPLGVSRNLLRSANVFNSVGLIAVSALLLWQAIERLLHPQPVQGAVPIIVGLSVAAANWMVARLLLKPARNNAAIRLAYIHNRGDIWVAS